MRFLTPIPILALLLLFSACATEDPCGPDLVFDEISYSCTLPPPDAASPAPAVDAEANDRASSDAGGAGESEPDAAALDAGPACPDPGFGTSCSVAGADSPECVCEADFCALQPGQSEGFCTRIHCLDTPGVCPAGYVCMDLSVIAPQVGSICVPG